VHRDVWGVSTTFSSLVPQSLSVGNGSGFELAMDARKVIECVGATWYPCGLENRNIYGDITSRILEADIV
jgi:hypothetical protein